MPGAPGKSGGRREGAGRPIQKISMVQGQQWFTTLVHLEGPELGQLAHVEIIDRNRVHIKFADGSELHLVK